MEARFKEVEALFNQGRVEEAENILSSIVGEEDFKTSATNYLGVIRQNQGRAEEAAEMFLAALARDPENLEIRSNLAFNLVGRGKWAEAKEQIQKLLAAASPANGAESYSRACGPESRPVLENEAKLWMVLAKAEQMLGNIKAALKCLDKSLQINPNQPDLKEARKKLTKLEKSSLSRRAAPKSKPSVLMCCQKHLDTFANALCDALEDKAYIRRVVADNFQAFLPDLKSAASVWLEWGSSLAIAATKEPGLLSNKKKVVVRLHSFEILNSQAAEINYKVVTDVVFVSNYMRRLFERFFPGRLQGTRSHVIHNGIDLARFPFVPNRPKSKIAFVGALNYKKDPMVMLQAFSFLRQRHPELELHVAGAPDNDRYHLAMPDFLAKNGLPAEAARLYGHVSDIPGWLADKDFILCTSPFESQGVGLLEAMHRGLRPLIYNFPGADELYPASCLWRNFEELDQLLVGGRPPEEYRDFVAEKYSMDRQADNFLKMLTEDVEVMEDKPVG